MVLGPKMPEYTVTQDDAYCDLTGHTVYRRSDGKPFRILQCKQHYWGDGATGFNLIRMKNCDYQHPSFWLRPEELESLYTEEKP